MYLTKISFGINTPDPIEPWKLTSQLQPYEHLSRILRLCVVHFRRNIKKLGDAAGPKVIAAMHSLASAHPLADYDGTIELIQEAGDAAKSECCNLFGLTDLT
jgi:hypothetical protein